MVNAMSIVVNYKLNRISTWMALKVVSVTASIPWIVIPLTGKETVV